MHRTRYPAYTQEAYEALLRDIASGEIQIGNATLAELYLGSSTLAKRTTTAMRRAALGYMTFGDIIENPSLLLVRNIGRESYELIRETFEHDLHISLPSYNELKRR